MDALSIAMMITQKVYGEVPPLGDALATPMKQEETHRDLVNPVAVVAGLVAVSAINAHLSTLSTHE